MNIESSNLSRVTETKQQNVSNNSQQAESSVTFADELNDMKKQEKLATEELKTEENVEVQKTEDEKNIESVDEKTENSSNTNLENVFNDLSNMVNEFNQTEDKLSGLVKNDTDLTDNDSVINKDYSIDISNIRFTDEFISKSTNEYLEYLNDILQNNNIGVKYRESINKEELQELSNNYIVVYLDMITNNYYTQEKQEEYLSLISKHFYSDGIISGPYIENNVLKDHVLLIPKEEV